MSAGDDTARSGWGEGFCPLPKWTLSDKRLRAGHLQCLAALCWMMDKSDHCAIAAQSRIASLTGRPRNKVAGFLRDLEEWGYIKKIKRGRHAAGRRRGHFKTLIYRVLYDPAETATMLPLGSHGSADETEARRREPCDPRGHKAVLPLGSQSRVTPGVTDSRDSLSRDSLSRATYSQRKQEEVSIFQAVARADRLERVADTAQQGKLPFAEVQAFDDLYREARKKVGFQKLVKLDLDLQRRHRKDRSAYHRALVAELTRVVAEPSETDGSPARHSVFKSVFEELFEA